MQTLFRDLRRYGRALFRALALTLRGQKPPSLEAEERHRALLAWSRETLLKVDAVREVIRRHSVDPNAVKMHIEGRDVTLEYALSVVRFHAAREYPHLIRSGNPHTSTAIQALNVNDRFLILRLSEHEALPDDVKTALHTLEQQFVNIVKE